MPVHKIKFGQEQLRQGQAELESARVAHAREVGRMEERTLVLRQVAKLTALSNLIARGEAVVGRLEGLRALPLPRQAGMLPTPSVPAASGADPAASGTASAASGARPARSRTPRALSKG